MTLDDLYAVPLGEFVAVRKQLAAAAKAAGDRAGATAVAKLARPTPSAWAANQLWRAARPLWDRLVDATRAVGRGDLAATGDQRAALAALRARAVELAQDAAQPASEAMLAKLDTNLRALAAHGWGEVEPGRLTDDLAPPGFEAMAEFQLAPPPPPPPPPPAPPAAAWGPTLVTTDTALARAAEVARAAEAARAAEVARAAHARKVAVLAERRADAAAARARVTEAAAALALARAEADRAELALADARARADAADREVAAAAAAVAAP